VTDLSGPSISDIPTGVPSKYEAGVPANGHRLLRSVNITQDSMKHNTQSGIHKNKDNIKLVVVKLPASDQSSGAHPNKLPGIHPVGHFIFN
jgi:hypothetical protein